MVDMGDLEQYLNDKCAKPMDIVEITGPGIIEEKTDSNGKVKKNLQLPVKLNGKALIYSPGKTARKPLSDAWGKNTDSWTGRKFQVSFMKMQVGKELLDVILPIPIKEEKK